MGSFRETYHLQTFIWWWGGGGGSLCPAPTPKSSVKFRDFDKSLSNLAILLILKTLFMSSGVDGFSLSIKVSFDRLHRFINI